MISRFFQILGGILSASALWLFWSDVRNDDAPAKLLGQLWYEAAPQSLQLTEAVIDRYIGSVMLVVSSMTANRGRKSVRSLKKEGR